VVRHGGPVQADTDAVAGSVPGMADDGESGPRRRGCLAADLAAAAAEVVRRHPEARLVRNRVGNLAVMVDGHMVGWLDLTEGSYDGE